MKIALVYDRINKIGGAERILLALHEIWPEAPLYTAVYDKNGAPWASVFDVKTSFLQNIPFAKSHHELFPILTPLAFESFNFDNYDIVISITSAEAKGIITKPKTLHICYCLTPTRYLWSESQIYLEDIHSGFFSPIIKKVFKDNLDKLRKWDRIASNRPDYYLSISKEVTERIKKYYHKDSEVIYPPVDIKKFVPVKDQKIGGYFLVVARMVPYKKIDIAIRAFNSNGLPLKIIGRGLESDFLKKKARKNIEFIEKKLTDEELIGYYQHCQALIFPGKEDFGLVMVEAQACGRPVIAYKVGGALEIIKEGITGEFFYQQESKSLNGVINKFKSQKYITNDCRKTAEKFDKLLFKELFKISIEKLYKEYQKNL